MYFSSILFYCVVFIGKTCCFNMSQLLTSSYAQVSRSGTPIKTNNEGRSHGQTPWTHSSDAHIIRGQNLRRKNPKIINKNDNIGEVIQERFNPKPWFGYEPNDNNNNKGPTYLPPNNDKPSVSDDFAVPFDSFPLALKPNGTNDDDDTAPKNTYGSTYTSYNPGPSLDQKNPDNFVTNSNKYLPPPPPPPPPMKTIKPPKYLPPENPKDVEPETPKYQYMSDIDGDGDGPPINDAYDEPYTHHQHHEPIKNDDNVPKYPGLPAYLDHDPNEGYNHHHHHHHDDNFFIHHHPPIYHEVKTTTEAAEDQRLNKKPYSYYYLGRKLWYIPLYFSVYFIIYVFVLIVKSIARHKITFNHYFEEDKREMPSHDHEHEHIELEKHVWNDIHAARRKYI